MNNPLDDIPDIDQLVEEAGLIPDVTCPLIDSVISDIDNAIRLATRRVERLDEDELRERLDDIEREFRSTEDTLEQIRSANDTLRALGHYWYGEYKWLHRHHTSLAESHVALQAKLVQLERQSLLTIAAHRTKAWFTPLLTSMRRATGFT